MKILVGVLVSLLMETNVNTSLGMCLFFLKRGSEIANYLFKNDDLILI